MKGEIDMKRFVSFIAAAMIALSSFPAFAAEIKDDAIKGVYNNGVLTVSETPGNADFAVLNLYTNGKLSKSAIASLESGSYSFSVSSEDAAKDMRIVYKTGEVYTVAVEKEVASLPSEEPTEKPASTPTEESIPEVYEKQSDAINAPAVITEISKTSVDGESLFVFELLYQGKTVKTNVREWITIKSAPESVSYLIGNTVESLAEGDIIHFACDLQGRIKNVDLIFRPDFKDYIGDGVALSSVVGKDNYSQIAFGVAVDGNKNMLFLADANGNLTDVEVDSKAFVYNIKNGRRGDIAELYGLGANSVAKTYIEKDNYDEDGNVVSWSEVSDKVYVIARVVRGLATDIFVIE